MDYAELVRRMRSWSGTHDVADAIEALIEAEKTAYQRGYREGLAKAAEIADGEAHEGCDVAEQIAKFIRVL